MGQLDVFHLLAAPGPFPEYADKLMLYGQFFVQLLGRQVGDRIVQEGVGSDHRRRVRWTFTDITSNSFLWLGEVSLDNGVTWFLEQEMRAPQPPTPNTRPVCASAKTPSLVTVRIIVAKPTRAPAGRPVPRQAGGLGVSPKFPLSWGVGRPARR